MTKADCKVLRGMAILCIVAHNYCHWMPAVVQENEFQWKVANVIALAHSISSTTSCLISDLLSFFGHYGVPVFVFLSAYGLEKKYSRGKELSTRAFIFRHYSKLWNMMFPGFLVSFAMSIWMIGVSHRYSIVEIVTMLGLVGNLLPDPSASIWPGPYWYFGLTFQLYVIYRLLIYRRSLWWSLVLITGCLCIQLFLPPEGEEIRWYRYNFPGSMLPFGLGVIAVRMERHVENFFSSSRVAALYFFVSLISLVLAGFNYFAWCLAPVFVCTLAITSSRVLPHHMRVLFRWFGCVSAALFVWHPVIRSLVIGVDIEPVIGFALYLLSSIALAWLMTTRLAHRRTCDSLSMRN